MIGELISFNLVVLLSVILCSSIIIFFLARSKLSDAHRKKQLHSWLLDNQFAEIDPDDRDLWNAISGNPLLSGKSRNTRVKKAYMRKMDGSVMWIVDLYSHVTQSGSGTNRPNRRHACIFSNRELHLPDVQMIPTQKLMNSIMRFTESIYGAVQGMRQDMHIRIANCPTFSESFLVLGRDEQSIQQLFSSALCRFFIGLRPLNLFFGASGQSFAFHYGRFIGIDDAAKMENQATILLKLFREEVGAAETTM